jgi:HlyD family secretion protein
MIRPLRREGEMNRKTALVGTAAGAVLLAVCLLMINTVASVEGQRPGVEEGRKTAAQPVDPVPGAAATRSAGKGETPALTLPAILVADNTADLYAKASGYVVQLTVDIGSRVRTGDVLVKLDIPEVHDDLRQSEAQLGAKQARVEAQRARVVQAQLAVKAAQAEQQRFEAERALSRVTYDRKTELYQGKAIPAQELDEVKSQLAVSEAKLLTAQASVASAEGAERAAEADVKTAEAEVALAQADVARLKTLIAYETIKAPFDGVVTRRNVDVGWFVRSAAQGATPWLLTLDKVDRVRAVIDIPEAEAPFVRAGTPVEIQVRSLDDPPLRATVTRTAMAIRSETRTMRAEADLKNEDGRLSPGMYAKVVIATGRKVVNP